MDHVGVDPAASQSDRELLGVEGVGQLGPAVRDHPAVAAGLLVVDIVPVDGNLGAGRVVREGRQEDDPAAVRDHGLHQSRQEVPDEVVHPNLHLEAVDRFAPLRDDHDFGVIDEDIGLDPGRFEPLGESDHRL